MYVPNANSDETSSRVEISCTQSSGTPGTVLSASRIVSTSMAFECAASLPPFKMTALPRHSLTEIFCIQHEANPMNDLEQKKVDQLYNLLFIGGL